MTNWEFAPHRSPEHVPTALSRLLEESQTEFAARSAPWKVAATAVSATQGHLDLPNVYADTANKHHQKQEVKHEDRHHNWLQDACDAVSGAVDVTAQVAVGAVTKAYEAVTEHPLETAAMLAEGAVIGVAVVAAAPVAAAFGASAAVVGGIALAADATLVGMTALGALNAETDIVHAAGASAASADVLMHKSSYSAAEVAAARQNVQAQTGGAALEAAATALMVRGTWSSAERLAGSAGKALERVRTTMSADEPSHVAAGREPVRESAWTAPSGRVAELNEASVMKGVSEQATSTKLQLPEGSASKLMGEIDDMLLYRQKQVDIETLVKGLNEADPNSFDAAWLKAQIRDELELRRALVGDLVNDNASQLFPAGVVPKLEVKQLLSDSASTRGSYSAGKVSLRNSDLVKPSYFNENETTKMRLANIISHEMEHGEQEGLMVRNLIEKATGGDTTGRALTASEITAIQEMGMKRADLLFKTDLIEDVNAKRPGKLLSPAEVSRAEGLEASELEHSDAHEARKFNTEQLARLTKEYNNADTAKHGILPSQLEAKDLNYVFGKDGPPQKVQELVKEFEQLPKGAPGKFTPEQFEFAKEATGVYQEAIKGEMGRFDQLIDGYDDAYRGWKHEIEAYDIGGQATKQMNSRYANSTDPMLTEIPYESDYTDYSNILTY